MTKGKHGYAHIDMPNCKIWKTFILTYLILIDLALVK